MSRVINEFSIGCSILRGNYIGVLYGRFGVGIAMYNVKDKVTFLS